MSSLTRWVLSHKRTVVLAWVVLAIAGIAAAGPASTRSSPSSRSRTRRAGRRTCRSRSAIAAPAAKSPPLVPVVTIPEDESVDSAAAVKLRPGCDRRPSRAGVARGAHRLLRLDRGRNIRLDDGRTTFAIVHPAPDPDAFFGENPRAERIARGALDGATVAGEPVKLTGFDALMKDAAVRARVPACCSRRCLAAAGALLVLGFVFASLLAFVPLVMAFVSIMTDLPAAARAHGTDGGLPHRPVPDRADRARRGDRLLPAGGLALARGALARPQRRRGAAAGDGDGRPRRGVQRRDGRRSACWH